MRYHVTHGADADGATCNIVLRITGHISDKDELIPVENPKDLPKALKNIPDFADVTITDLNITMDAIKEMRRFGRTLIIDHHDTLPEVIDSFRELPNCEYLISSDRCAALHCAVHFNAPPDVVKLAKFVDKRDRFTDPYNRIAREISTLFKIVGFDEFIKSIVEATLEDTHEMGWIDVLYGFDNLRAHIREEDEYLEKALRNATYICESMIGRVSITVAERMASDIGYALTHDHDVTMAVIVAPVHGRISFRSAGFDCLPYARYLGGGGHRCACGASIPNKKWITNLLYEVRWMIYEVKE